MLWRFEKNNGCGDYFAAIIEAPDKLWAYNYGEEAYAKLHAHKHGDFDSEVSIKPYKDPHNGINEMPWLRDWLDFWHEMAGDEGPHI